MEVAMTRNPTFGVVVWLVIAAGAALAATTATPAAAQLRVVTTTEDLASLATEIGGDRVAVESLARGRENPHFVEPKPSFLLRLNRADLLIVVGRELEIGWLPPLITQSRNARIQPGAPGHLDASQGVRILQIPTGQITRAMGDVHPSGNPHYWLDPANGLIMARTIADRLAQLRPNDRLYLSARLTDFEQRLRAAQARWDAALAPYKGAKVVTYHNSWPNFAERFALDVVGYVEPKPGIPPPASHIVDLIGEMRRQQIKVIIVEPYFDLRTPESVARETGATVLVLPPSVGGAPEATGYIALFDHLVAKLAATLRSGAGR
jgi:ABC-type Zn uptake system ZnuABC Zn-binding protein ZnuA